MFEPLYENDIIYLTIIGIIGIALILLFIVLIINSKKRKKEIKLEPINDELNNSDVNKVENNNPILREQIEFSKPKDDIGNVILAMQKNIETKKNDPVMSFEEEQEEKAIISYHELLKAKRANPQEFVDELENKVEIIDFPKETIEEVAPIKRENVNETPRFTNTEFISPVYGRMNGNDIPTQVKPEIKPEPKKEVPTTVPVDRKNDKFLEELKQFRRNL